MESPQFRIGARVRVRSERDKVGVITEILPPINQRNWYEVFFDATDIRNLPEPSLEVARSKADILELLKEGAFAKKETLSKLITYTKLTFPLRNNLYALGSSRTEFYAYQFKPLLKFLDSHDHRLLIADEVGLGKTIEAGLILIEQRARLNLDRILIVCPSSLKEKWQMELKNRFDEHFEIYDSTRMREFLKRLDEEGESARIRAICSLQTLRSRALLEELEAASPLDLDFVVIDEAHHMRNSATNAHVLGSILSESADVMLFLTATPVHLGSQDLFQLLRILNPEEFDSIEAFNNRLAANEPVLRALHKIGSPTKANLHSAAEDLRSLLKGTEGTRFARDPMYVDVVERLEQIDGSDTKSIIEIQRDVHHLSLLTHILTRTKKRDVQQAAMRTPHIVKVTFTPEEMAFYNAVTQFVIERARSKTPGSFAAFASMMPQRQVASSLPVVANAILGNQSDVLGGGLDSELSDLIPEEMVDDNQDESYEASDKTNGTYAQMLECAVKVAGIDTKYSEFSSALRELEAAEPGRKIIVFSYFKKTLRYLSKRLSDEGFTNVVLNGDVPQEERSSLIRNFKENSLIRILLSSEVGSEGLDFQFCHVIFNYDLPWNPMVVEQRIGRVDRIGQKAERILIYNMSVVGTIEAQILERLYARIHIFEQSIGDLEAILGEEMRTLTCELLTSHLTQEERSGLIEQVAMRIERKRIDMETLEEKSATLIGHDRFFDEELARIRENKLYLSPEALKVFVSEFLERNFPHCTLTQTTSPGMFRLTVDEPLRDKIRSTMQGDDVTASRFLRKAAHGVVDVTFDNQVAYAEEEIEFITNYHPLVRTVASYYSEHSDDLHPVSKIRLETDLLSRGSYLYFLYRQQIKALRSENLVELVVVALSNLDVVRSGLSDKLLEMMIINGTTLDGDPLVTTDLIEHGCSVADAAMDSRLEQKRKQMERTNSSLIDNQLSSLRQSFEIKKKKKEVLLGRALEKHRAPQYIRMLEGGIRNLDFEFQRKTRELESNRRVDVSFGRIAAGYLSIS